MRCNWCVLHKLDAPRIPGSTENARTLNETAYTVANFRRSNRLRMTVTNVGDNFIRYGSWDSAQIFSGLSPIGGSSTESPAIAVFMNRQYMAVKGVSNNNIYLRHQDYWGNWSSWETISGATNKSPALAVFNNRLYLAVKGVTNNNIYLRSMDASGTWDPSWLRFFQGGRQRPLPSRSLTTGFTYLSKEKPTTTFFTVQWMHQEFGATGS